jgi:hypothetical protein
VDTDRGGSGECVSVGIALYGLYNDDLIGGYVNIGVENIINSRSCSAHLAV